MLVLQFKTVFKLQYRNKTIPVFHRNNFGKYHHHQRFKVYFQGCTIWAVPIKKLHQWSTVFCLFFIQPQTLLVQSISPTFKFYQIFYN